MNPTQAAKTMFAGFAVVLSVTAGAVAWGLFRGVVKTVPVESGWVFIVVAVAALVSIPTMFATLNKLAK